MLINKALCLYCVRLVNRCALLSRQLVTVLGQYYPSFKTLQGKDFSIKRIVGQFTGTRAHETIIFIGRNLSHTCAYIFFILSLILKKNKEIIEIIVFFDHDTFFQTVMKLSCVIKICPYNLLLLLVLFVNKIVLQPSLIILDSLKRGVVECQ